VELVVLFVPLTTLLEIVLEVLAIQEFVILDMLIVIATNKVMDVKSISLLILITVGLALLFARITIWPLELVQEESVTETVLQDLLTVT